jgi:hypothetical protein
VEREHVVDDGGSEYIDLHSKRLFHRNGFSLSGLIYICALKLLF